MDYFALDELGSINVKRKIKDEFENSVIYYTEEIKSLENVDYIEKDFLISDRFKNFIEFCIPDCKCKPYVFLDTIEKSEKTFWKIEYQQCNYFLEYINQYRLDMELYKVPENLPYIFQTEIKKGIHVIFVHLSIAEGLMRRGILGLRLISLDDFMLKLNFV